MRIRIGGLEVLDPTMEELDQLVQRYGVAQSARNSPEKTGENVIKRTGARAADSAVLRRLVDVGENGIEVNVLGGLLGKKGKAMRGAAKAWAQRVGLLTNDIHECFEELRVGTKRGLRIKPSLSERAKALMQEGSQK